MSSTEKDRGRFRQLKRLPNLAASFLLAYSVSHPINIQSTYQDTQPSAILAGFNVNCPPQNNLEITIPQGSVIDSNSSTKQQESLPSCLTKKEIRNLNKLRTAAIVYFISKNMDYNGEWKWWSDDIPKGVNIYDRWNSHYLPDIDPSQFNPRLELVSGQDPEYIRYVFKKLSQAHIDNVYESWWGIEDESNIAFDKSQDILEAKDSPAPNLKVAAYVEIPAYRVQMSDEEIITILKYLKKKTERPSYMRVEDERPMLKIYTSDDSWFSRPANQWGRLAMELGFYVDMRVYNHGLYIFDQQPDAWHLYRSDVREARVDRSLMVSPGFFLAKEKYPRLAEDPKAFRESILRGLSLAAKGQIDELLFVGNEFVEGAGILPQTLVKRKNGKFVEDPNGLPSDTNYNIVRDTLELIPRERPGQILTTAYMSQEFVARQRPSETNGILLPVTAQIYSALGVQIPKSFSEKFRRLNIISPKENPPMGNISKKKRIKIPILPIDR